VQNNLKVSLNENGNSSVEDEETYAGQEISITDLSVSLSLRLSLESVWIDEIQSKQPASQPASQPNCMGTIQCMVLEF